MPPDSKDTHWSVNALNEHIKELRDAERDHIMQMFADRDVAIKVAVANIDRRMVQLNHSHEALAEDRNRYLTKDGAFTWRSIVERRLEELARDASKSQLALTENYVPREELASTSRALDVRFDALGRRLDEIAKIQVDVLETRKDYFTRDSHALFVDQQNKTIAVVNEQSSKQYIAIQSQIAALQKPNYLQWIAALGLLLGLISGEWWLAVEPLKDNITQTRESIARIDTESKARDRENTQRIDDHLKYVDSYMPHIGWPPLQQQQPQPPRQH